MNVVKKVSVLVIVVMMVSVSLNVFVGAARADDKLRVVLYLNGTLGDKSFFDSAARGVTMAVDELGIMGKVIEGGYDSSRWEPDLAQLSEGGWDIIIAGTWQLTEFVEKYARMHPDTAFFTYDTTVDYSAGDLGNVYSILYSQNEGSFLVGALAAMITTSDLPAANPEKIIGFLGGMDIPVINDFKVGYTEGAQYIDPEVKVLTSYIDSFSDSAKGKELGLALYDQGVDIGFNVAGQAGLGLLDAAKNKDRYVLGVDSDQYLLFAESDPEKAAWVVTSMLKNVDLSIFRGIKMFKEGTLANGQAEVLGVAENGVGVAQNENFTKLVPEEYRAKIKEIEEKILSGEITVGTAFGE